MRLQKHQIFPLEASLPLNAPRELCSPEILHYNRLDPRATLVPAQKTGIYYHNKELSDRIVSLNGNYRFALFSDTAPEAFEQPFFDDQDWDIIDVPSMWQFRGYGEPTYPNVDYPFPFYPPYICCLNPVGCYRRTFQIKKQAKLPRAILHFAGVDNAFYVYLNGEFVGFSKGSRLPAEFDVSQLLKDGENTLAVKVYTYSDASYLENQDMLMANGIFRDVFLIFSPASGLWDYSIITDTEKLTCCAELFDDTVNAICRYTLNNDTRIVPFEKGRASVVFRPEDLLLWTAETPNLYDFTIEVLVENTVIEVHSKRVGFCTSRLSGSTFLVNDHPILIKGINRHENNCDNGRTMTVRQILDDLKLIKSNNINSIRCSHYTNNPAFYEFCSELGIYVMDEADLETHGCNVTGDQGFLNKSDSWLPAFMDRVVRMAERDKNETCVTLWSIGNEIGCGKNADKCAAYLRSREDKKPVRFDTENSEISSFVLTGYPRMADLEIAVEQNRQCNKPIMILEYGHAMGNSPGNLEHIQDYIWEHPAFCGGYVWEFRSHGMRRRTENGGSDFLYGGDFHDTHHWSNFTLDGYLTSAGTPKPSFRELKYVYSPMRFTLNGNTLTATNTRDFLDTSDIMLTVTVSADMNILEKYPLRLPTIQPKQSADIELVLPKVECVEMFVTIDGYIGDNHVILKQFQVAANTKKAFSEKSGTLTYSQNNDQVQVTGDNFTVAFANGVPVYYQKEEQIYFDEPMQFATYRAEIDNDGITGLFPRWIQVWETFRLNRMHFHVKDTNITQEEHAVKIVANGVLTVVSIFFGFHIHAEYTVHSDGFLSISLLVEPFGDMPKLDTESSKTPRLPRFGVAFKMSKNYNRVRWYGRGQDHCYTDALAAAPVGVYDLPLDQLNFHYDVPQDTGSRCDTRFLQVKNHQNAFTVYGNNCFSFQYHPWKLDALRSARHPSELTEDTRNYLYIDYRTRALGSLSCGPNPEVEYDFEPHDFRFVFAINGEDIRDVPEYFNRDFGEKTEKLSCLYTRDSLQTVQNVIECRRN